MANFVVVLDANVLYGIEVTDLLLTLATRRLFRPHWSPQILEEVRRNLALRDDLEMSSINRRIAFMNRALPGGEVEIPTALIDAMPVNEKDRHVLALAVHVGAPTIVTNNLKDFPPALCAPHGVEALNADEFVLHQVHLYRDGVIGCIDAIAARRKRRPKNREDIIARLSAELPDAMAAL